jgi:hypothetical protein
MERTQKLSSRTVDLNIFYREDWNEDDGTTWAETLTIDPYIYEEDEHGTRKYELDLLIECTPAETAVLAQHYPEQEYGSDWWDFMENLMQFAPPRIASLLKTIDVDAPHMDIVTALDPNWWVTKNAEMLF